MLLLAVSSCLEADPQVCSRLWVPPHLTVLQLLTTKARRQRILRPEGGGRQPRESVEVSADFVLRQLAFYHARLNVSCGTWAFIRCIPAQANRDKLAGIRKQLRQRSMASVGHGLTNRQRLMVSEAPLQGVLDLAAFPLLKLALSCTIH